MHQYSTLLYANPPRTPRHRSRGVANPSVATRRLDVPPCPAYGSSRPIATLVRHILAQQAASPAWPTTMALAFYAAVRRQEGAR